MVLCTPTHRFAGDLQEQQLAAGADPEVSGRLPGVQASHLLTLLLPLQRRAAGDPLPDQEPPGRAAASQEVL